MRGNELLEKMALVDASYVEAAGAMPEKKKYSLRKWAALAACLCLVFAGALQWNKAELAPTPPVPSPDGTIERQEMPEETITQPLILRPGDEGYIMPDIPLEAPPLVFNEVESFVPDGARRYIPGYFTRELDAKALSYMVPNGEETDMDFSAVAGFDGAGTLLEMFLTVSAPFLDAPMHAVFTRGEPVCYYVITKEPDICVLNSKEFTLYRWTPDGTNYVLEADASLDQWSIRLSCETTAEKLDEAIYDFEKVLLYFSAYNEGEPKFEAITAGEIPEYFDRQLTLEEARNDVDFGTYLPDDLPVGFIEESLRRYKDQKNDYLSGLWCRGLATISWKVSAFTKDDEARLVKITEREKYDLSLYPIPRADSVPEELREVVDHPIFDIEELTLDALWLRAYMAGEAGEGDGWRMSFGVKCGEKLIEVQLKGVEPDWVYQQLLCQK